MEAMGIPVNHPHAMPSDPLKPSPHHPLHPHSGGFGPFSTGLCDCFSNLPNCCLTCWCPCITFGRIAEIVDRGQSSCVVSGLLYALLVPTGCQCLYSCNFRSKLRVQYGIEAGSCGDCCVHYCCEMCALCQEYRELEHRGFDPALGWEGHMQRQNQGFAMAAPAAPGGMMR